MNKLLVSLVVLLGTAGAFAQANNGVTVSTDPARAEAVERHAQELQARPTAKAAGTPLKSSKVHNRQQRRHHGKKH